MACILHLSDLHIVNQSSWNNMKNAIFTKLHDKMYDLPSDQKMIIITGDFHNYSESNYDKATEFIQQLVEVTNVDVKQDIFVIPGNHDMHLSDDPKTKKIQSNNIKSTFNDPDEIEDEVTIEMLMEPFELYSAFVKNLGIYNESDPSPASVHVRTWRNKLNILHTNTAIVADGIEEHKKGQLLDICKMTSEDIRKDLSNNFPTIALGHNSYYDLHEKIKISAAALFCQEQVSAYLSGDQHRFNQNREEQFIYLNANFSDNKIPNIICAKCSADSKDKYSDFGFIIHEWNENTGQVDIERFKYSLNKDQDDFESRLINNLYFLKRGKHRYNQKTKQEAEELSKFSVLLKKYQEYIERQCGEIELSGLPTNVEDLRRSYALERIFVPLSFSRESKEVSEMHWDMTYEPIIKTDIEMKNNDQGSKLPQNMNMSGRTHMPLPFNRLFDEFNHNHQNIALGDLIPAEGIFRELILADPGAGKTTLLKYIASHYVSKKHFAEESSTLTVRQLFPIWIRCRDIIDKHNSITEMINNIPHRAEWGLNDTDLNTFTEMVKNQIDRGNALLLIDGLDEIISERDRRDFVEHLDLFAKNNESVNIIVTSRKKGFSIVSNRLFSDYDYLEINPLNRSGITDLCVRWNNLVYGGTTESFEEANKLSETIIHDERLLRLAKNPLLLTTLLLVKRRLGNLPTKRAGLYYEAVHVLLETWNSEQHERIDLDESMYQLAYIAFWMSTNKDKEISFSKGRITKTNLLTLLKQFKQSFPHLVYSNSLTPSGFINIVERRSALLIRTGMETEPDGHEEPIYEFQHLTFQEYLAAYAVCKCCYPNADPNNRDGQVLIPYLTDSNMKEIIQLTVAIEPYCAKKLSQEALELYKKTTSVNDWDNLRYMLLQFIADEVAINPEAVYTILDECFDKGIFTNDKSVLKQIVEGKNSSLFRKVLKNTDDKNYGGYPHYEPLYRILSGEEISLDQNLAMMNSTDPKQIVEGLALINSRIMTEKNRIGTYITEHISNKVYFLLNSDNIEVRKEALATIYLWNIVSSTEQFIKYINAVINACNGNYLNFYLFLTDFEALEISNIPANTIAKLDAQGMAKIFNILQDTRFHSIGEYRIKMTLLAYASFGNAELNELKKAYELVADFKKNMKDDYIQEIIILKCFRKLLNMVGDVSKDIDDLFVQYCTTFYKEKRNNVLWDR